MLNRREVQQVDDAVRPQHQSVVVISIIRRNKNWGTNCVKKVAVRKIGKHAVVHMKQRHKGGS